MKLLQKMKRLYHATCLPAFFYQPSSCFKFFSRVYKKPMWQRNRYFAYHSCTGTSIFRSGTFRVMWVNEENWYKFSFWHFTYTSTAQRLTCVTITWTGKPYVPAPIFLSSYLILIIRTFYVIMVLFRLDLFKDRIFYGFSSRNKPTPEVWST